MMLAAEQAPPTGGAALDQVLIAFGAFAAIYVPLGIFLLRERDGKPTLIGRLADRVSAFDGLPRWAGLPSYLATLSLITCAFGVYWDVPIHMQNGRDEGPLANPSHFPIMFGIFFFLAAGVISAGLARDPLPRRTVRLTPKWRVPMGTLVLLGAGMIAAAGFPADDVWHRLFGQDVTEWGPTHVMMIGGAVTCILAVPLLLAESAQVGRPPAARWTWMGGLATGGAAPVRPDPAARTTRGTRGRDHRPRRVVHPGLPHRRDEHVHHPDGVPHGVRPRRAAVPGRDDVHHLRLPHRLDLHRRPALLRSGWRARRVGDVHRRAAADLRDHAARPRHPPRALAALPRAGAVHRVARPRLAAPRPGLRRRRRPAGRHRRPGHRVVVDGPLHALPAAAGSRPDAPDAGRRRPRRRGRRPARLVLRPARRADRRPAARARPGAGGHRHHPSLARYGGHAGLRRADGLLRPARQRGGGEGGQEPARATCAARRTSRWRGRT
ncbi:hypothetical protein G5V59_00940 [Nocardioides sp. W3-2-3]|uniref:hypothetical protein n=1 Tax=Nocardioides convexus TaxID=2712224 RepID=UPI00241849C5|nr:hypothetical protein [Nocardioides convexus]NGZ99482.1 hypothetical protein [Nocardioides convexus]